MKERQASEVGNSDVPRAFFTLEEGLHILDRDLEGGNFDPEDVAALADVIKSQIEGNNN